MNIKAIASAIILSAVSVAPMAHASEYCQAMGNVAEDVAVARDEGLDKGVIDQAIITKYTDGDVSPVVAGQVLSVTNYVYRADRFSPNSIRAIVNASCTKGKWETK